LIILVKVLTLNPDFGSAVKNQRFNRSGEFQERIVLCIFARHVYGVSPWKKAAIFAVYAIVTREFIIGMFQISTASDAVPVFGQQVRYTPVLVAA